MNNLLDPAILFFVLGVTAGLMKSNLEVPPALSRFLSLYLLMALGLKGGFALAKSGVTVEVLATLACAMSLAVIVPVLGWFVLKRLLPPFDAIAVAATYGSVSAVTFVTAVHVLEQQGTPAGGHLAAAMALMESPAILFGVAMAGVMRSRQTGAIAEGASLPLAKLAREALTDGGTVLLMGALLVGLVTGESGAKAMQPFTVDLFKGLLAFFLLDMGLLTARHVDSLKKLPVTLLVYGILGPIAHSMIALLLARIAGLSIPDATLLAVLAASASYIAVPAVLRTAVPEARPGLYFGLSLGLTFPFNLLMGIPLYQFLAKAFLG